MEFGLFHSHSDSTDSLDWHCSMGHECGKCSTMLIYYILITQSCCCCYCHTNWLAISQLDAIAFYLAQLQRTCAFPMSQPKQPTTGSQWRRRIKPQRWLQLSPTLDAALPVWQMGNARKLCSRCCCYCCWCLAKRSIAEVATAAAARLLVCGTPTPNCPDPLLVCLAANGRWQLPLAIFGLGPGQIVNKTAQHKKKKLIWASRSAHTLNGSCWLLTDVRSSWKLNNCSEDISKTSIVIRAVNGIQVFSYFLLLSTCLWSCISLIWEV